MTMILIAIHRKYFELNCLLFLATHKCVFANAIHTAERNGFSFVTFFSRVCVPLSDFYACLECRLFMIYGLRTEIMQFT